MPKFIITWDAGYGETNEVIDADSFKEAQSIAYDEWKQEAESSAEYKAEVFTEELAEDYGL